MTASITITDATNSRLEELQQKIRRETGRDVSEQQLLERIVMDGDVETDELIESFRDEFEPLLEDEIERWLSGTTDCGVETTEEDIDEILYGDK